MKKSRRIGTADSEYGDRGEVADNGAVARGDECRVRRGRDGNGRKGVGHEGTCSVLDRGLDKKLC
jgi:hypothetical protein